VIVSFLFPSLPFPTERIEALPLPDPRERGPPRKLIAERLREHGRAVEARDSPTTHTH
jgi:hypothetical protein